MCGNKCKCVDCLNYVGSQALIDKRRKIKDHRGAEFAMQTADDAWKGKNIPPPQPRTMNAPQSGSGGRHPAPSPGPSRLPLGHHGQHHPPHLMMRPSPPPHHLYSPRSAPPGPQPHFAGHPSMAHPSMGYPAMGMAMHHQGASSHLHGNHGTGDKSKIARNNDILGASKPPPRVASLQIKTKANEARQVVTDDPPVSTEVASLPVAAEEMNSSTALDDAQPEGLVSSTPPVEPIDSSIPSPNEQPVSHDDMPVPDSKADESDSATEPTAAPEASKSMQDKIVVEADELSMRPAPATPITGSSNLIVAAETDASSKGPSQHEMVIETDEPAVGPNPALPSEALDPMQLDVVEIAEKASSGVPAFAVSEASEHLVPDKAMEISDSTKEPCPPSPTVAVPRTPGVRLGYDPYSSKKKRHLSPGQKEATLPYFGTLPEQPKTTALTIFSFLSNDEIYSAGLVCKRWSRLAMDEELWQF